MHVIGHAYRHDDDDAQCQRPRIICRRETQPDRGGECHGDTADERGGGGVLLPATRMIDQSHTRGDTNQQQRDGEGCEKRRDEDNE